MIRDLRASLKAVLDGRSAFEARDGAQTILDVPPFDFSAFAGHFLFWPLGNGVVQIRRLIEAIDGGVVPILMPPRVPAHKLSALRGAYPGFGIFDGEAIEPAAVPAIGDGEVMVCVMTSGSTGRPKLVAASGASLAAGVAEIHAAQRLDDIGRTGVMLPLAYSFAFVNQLLWAIAFERKLFLLAGMLDPGGTFAMLREYRIDMLCMVANQAQTLEGLGFGADDAVETMRVVNFAGGPFPVAVFPALRAMFPAARILNNYGCTEAMPRLTVAEVSGKDHPVTLVGAPMGGVELRIGGNEAVGPIEFRAPSASIGLLQGDGSLLPHADWIASGDIGRTADGMLHVLGRHDQILKLGGERISLIEIEQAFQSDGLNGAIAWMHDSGGDPELLAVVISPTPPLYPELNRHLRERLPRPMWPARLFWREEWPLLPNGKVDRLELQQQACAGGLLQLHPAL